MRTGCLGRTIRGWRLSASVLARSFRLALLRTCLEAAFDVTALSTRLSADFGDTTATHPRRWAIRGVWRLGLTGRWSFGLTVWGTCFRGGGGVTVLSRSLPAITRRSGCLGLTVWGTSFIGVRGVTVLARFLPAIVRGWWGLGIPAWGTCFIGVPGATALVRCLRVTTLVTDHATN